MDYDILYEAARERKTLLLEYESPTTGKYSEGREVEPYEMKNGFLWAYDINAGSIKKFSIEGIYSIEKTERVFIPRWPIKIM